MSISGIRHNLHKIEGVDIHTIQIWLVVCICDQKCYHVSVTLNFEVGHKLCRAVGRSENPERGGGGVLSPTPLFGIHIILMK